MSNSLADPQQCRATRKDGSQCRGQATASGYCFAHDPAASEGRARGGRNRSRAARSIKALPERLRPIADTLAGALDEVHRGELDPRQATAMAALAGAYVRVLTAGEYESRIRALETAMRDAPGA